MLARHLIQYFGVLSRPYKFPYIIEFFCCIKYTIYIPFTGWPDIGYIILVY